MNKYSFLLILVINLIFAGGIAAIAQGLQPAPVISGDTAVPLSVPTGSSSTLNPSIFSVYSRQLPVIINLRTETYSHNTKQYMGKRIVLTFKTSAVNAMQMDLISSILQANFSSLSTNKHDLTFDVSQSQLKQIQNVFAMHNQESRPSPLFSKLPIVRKWCCLVVALGLVFATVMLAIAAYGMVMSHRGSADKVISTMAGLMVLLMAYTIYSLLVNNLSNHLLSDRSIPSPLH